LALRKSPDGEKMKNDFCTRLRNNDVLIGTIITIPATEVTEIVSEIGFDWLFVDTEHSSFNARGAQTVLQAAGERCPCVIRVPANDEVWIKKALDIGADGIIAPQVNSAEEAQRIVQMCKYPPLGRRGVGIGRAHKYGLRFKEYMQSANDKIAVILQAETVHAVKNISAIAKVPGIDAVFVGPYDLSASLGKMGQLTDNEVREAIAAVTAGCKNAGMRLGIFADSAESAEPYIQQGYTLIAIGTDALHLASGAQATVNALKR